MALASGANEIFKLIDQLESRSRSTVDSARTRLLMLGARAVEPLHDALEGDRDRIRKRVLPLLGLIGDSRSREPLLAMLLDHNPRLRERAARALGQFSEGSVAATLERAAPLDRSVRVQLAAVESLVTLYQAGVDSAARLPLRLVTDPTQPTALRLAALNLLGAGSFPRRNALFDRLRHDPDPEVKRAAKALRKRLQKLAKNGKPTLSPRKRRDAIRALDSAEYSEWSPAIRTLALGGESVVIPLIRAMEKRAENPEFCVRAGIVFRLMGPRRARDLMDAIDILRSPLPLRVLVETIGASGQKAWIYRLEVLIRRLTEDAMERPPDEADPLEPVRALAHLQLARLGSRVAIEDLRLVIGNPKMAVSDDHFLAIALIGQLPELRILLELWHQESLAARPRIARAVREIIRRERIRRNSRVLSSLTRSERRALAAILPPSRPALALRNAVRSALK